MKWMCSGLLFVMASAILISQGFAQVLKKQHNIIFMANSSNGNSIFKELLEILIKDTYTP
jgi:hypothetical protein